MALYFKHPMVAIQEFGILIVPLELLLKININLMLEATLMERAKTECGGEAFSGLNGDNGDIW